MDFSFGNQQRMSFCFSHSDLGSIFHLHISSQMLYFSVSRNGCTAELCFLMYHLLTMVLHNSYMLFGDAQLIAVIHTINCNAGYLNYLFHMLGWGQRCRRKTLLEVKGKFIHFFHDQYVIKY